MRLLCCYLSPSVSSFSSTLTGKLYSPIVPIALIFSICFILFIPGSGCVVTLALTLSAHTVIKTFVTVPTFTRPSGWSLAGTLHTYKVCHLSSHLSVSSEYLEHIGTTFHMYDKVLAWGLCGPACAFGDPYLWQTSMGKSNINRTFSSVWWMGSWL